MHSIELHQRINEAFDLLYRLGLWHRGDVVTARETGIKIFYSLYSLLFPISFFVGSFQSENDDESILLAESGVMTIVMQVKLHYIIWRKREIVDLLHRIGVYSIKDKGDFNLANGKINRFMKIMTCFYTYSIFIAICVTLIVPFVGNGNDKKLFFNVGFPLDYKTSEISYWIAFAFIVTEVFLCSISVLFSILMWFLLLNCGLKYEVLGSQLRNMGVIGAVDASGNTLEISKVELQNLFSRDLIAGMESYEDINESTQQVESFLSKLFSLELATSAICICSSIYCLAYINKESPLETMIYCFYLLYNIFDIFMVLYFGNEIKLKSDRLSYCLFESNWIDQPQSCKKSIIIFGERLKRAHELVVLKLYPLTLETFTRILNSAYSMFNILKNLT